MEGRRTAWIIWIYLAVEYVAMVLPVDTDDRWSSWSTWSECSRTCDGGAAYQIRHCLRENGELCAGEAIRYKTCNNEPCPPGSIDFRLQQCQSYDDVPYRNTYYKWEPFYDKDDPCSLQCTAKGSGLRVVLAPKVLDGTRCNKETKDMCINGICRTVGCDHVLGSTAKEDVCGVCGGNGSSCIGKRHPEVDRPLPSPSAFVWKLSQFSACSVSCGVGEQVSTPVCVDTQADRVVYPLYCDQTTKPVRQMRICTQPSCQPTWITAEWLACSKSCGGGVSTRNVYCVQVMGDGSFKPSDQDCLDEKPASKKPCNQFPCPVWKAGDWAPCSVTCGRGVQYREVICKPTKTHNCSIHDKPITTRQCDTGVNCVKPKVAEFSIDKHDTSDKEDEESLQLVIEEDQTNRPKLKKIDNRPILKVLEENQPKPANVFFQSAKESDILSPPSLAFEPPEGSEEFDWDDGSGLRGADPGLGDAMKAFLSEPEAFMSDPVNEITLSTTPRFVTSAWSECSNTCGTGLRNRRVVCQVYVEFAGKVQTLPDSECVGPKPAETEICKRRSCDHVSPLEKDVYIWSFTGYGPCNATCIGGYKNATFSCKRVRDFATVSSHYCQHIHLPDMEPQPCNVIPCTPQWQASPAGPCSALCGGGYQIQRILCVRRYGWGREDIQIVKPQYCAASEQPPRKIVCNTQPCPPSWRVGSWSKCSKTCGNATQTREVICEQRLGPGVTEELMDESLCLGVKPSTVKYCDLPRCPGRSYSEYIVADNSWLVQMAPLPRIYIDVGGRATVLPRTTVKVRCRVRKLKRRLIVWKRDGVVVPEKGRIRRSKKGLLLIRKSRTTDTGVYTCEAGNASQNVTILFHSPDSAAIKLAERRHMISRLGKFYASIRIGDSKASLVAIEKHFRHWSAIPFHYVTSDWSACSKSCGGAGLQNRRISCDLVLPSYYFIVRDEFCTNRGQEKPADSRDCGFQKCPHWEVSEWSHCSDRHCVRNRFGARLRNLMCVAHNNSLVPLELCDPATRPNDTMPCPAERCYARWKTSPWSRCSKTCGGKGYKTRAISCVWALTGKPAGANCKHIRRPELRKECNSPKTCVTGCRDRSKYCSLIPRLNFCRFKQYSEECCESCAAHEEYEKHQMRLRKRV